MITAAAAPKPVTAVASETTARVLRLVKSYLPFAGSSVGQQFSVTRERIRQIEAKALRKLKHPSRSRQLKSFFDS